MVKPKRQIPVESEAGVPKITLGELEVDVSAFLHFLSEHFQGETKIEVPSFWMLIPKSLDVEWRDGVEEFHLEKEVFSRKILVVARPVPESERQRRRAELLMIFHNAIAEDQVKQIILLISRLRDESRQVMIEKFHRFRSTQESRV